jgi:pimeloyl-ACP methyl ester carboxylesterase
VAAVADLVGLDRFAVAGYSLGSLVAQTAARRHPDRVGGLVLCASATHFARSEAAQRRLANIAARAPLSTGVVASRGLLDETAQGRWAWQQFRSTSAREVSGAARVIACFDSRAWIAGVGVPTAVVVTTQDRLIPPVRQRELAARIRGALVYEAAAGHASCVLGAARFTPALAAACASVSARMAVSSPSPR